ncbi:MAG: tRNA (guanosine(46)-N7)-methyltransferase TrmB [Pirellulaceae bacterium]|nr:tRNA (guanosine(46)-N7)-methyltransferase TrmB [Pirellulaceae bacterium]
MGRRALPKLNPTVEFDSYLHIVKELEEGSSPETFFKTSRPIELEIGCGKGLFLAGVTGEKPEHNFLGIEVSAKYASYSAYQLARRERENGHILSGDALGYMRDHVLDHSLTAVHIYFPDPWWKDRHRKRRVLNEVSAKDIQRVLIPGGKLHFWTDVQEYYESALEILAASTTLSAPIDVVEKPAEHDLDYRTHFERRTRKNGEPVYRAQFVKETAA